MNLLRVPIESVSFLNTAGSQDVKKKPHITEVFMFCPACKDAVLSMTERQGVEIDYCPKCRGVWLDRGELDKILEKSVAEAAPPVQQSQPYPQQPHQQHQPQYQQPHYKGHKRRKSFLEELFD